ncbi:MAG: hypothetical protein MK212_07355 [Saprospiraceae bacterium]|nr:hypothetical protein [Saprospiraceae bacterium]
MNNKNHLNKINGLIETGNEPNVLLGLDLAKAEELFEEVVQPYCNLYEELYHCQKIRTIPVLDKNEVLSTENQVVKMATLEELVLYGEDEVELIFSKLHLLKRLDCLELNCTRIKDQLDQFPSFPKLTILSLDGVKTFPKETLSFITVEHFPKLEVLRVYNVPSEYEDYLRNRLPEFIYIDNCPH